MGSKSKHKPTADNQKLARALAMSGFTDAEIAEQLDCAESTLKKYYASQLREGRKIANAKVVASLYNNAIGGNVTAQIFWCKTRLGWREIPEVQPNEKPSAPQRPIYRELKHGEPTPDDLKPSTESEVH